MLNYLCTALAVLTVGGASLSATTPDKTPTNTPATLQGVVIDTAGKPIADAKLEITDPTTKTSWSFRTSATGEFKIDSLVPSQTYSIVVTRLGYKAAMVEQVAPSLSTTFRMQVTLRPREVVILPAFPASHKE